MRNMKLSVLIVSAGVLVAPAALAEIHTGDSHDDHVHDHDHDHGEHGEFYPVHNETTADGMPVCATDPGLAECASYAYPDKLALEGAKLNCQMMEFMVACDIIEACEDGTLSADNPHCDNFDMLASTCKDEGMSGMAGCKVYTPMCLNESSVVKICEAHPGVPSMVNSMPTVVRSTSLLTPLPLPFRALQSEHDDLNDPFVPRFDDARFGTRSWESAAERDLVDMVPMVVAISVPHTEPFLLDHHV